MENKSSDYTGDTSIFLELDDQQYNMQEISKRVRADYKAAHKEKLKDLKIYVKPEDGKAYYTANDGSISGSVDI